MVPVDVTLGVARLEQRKLSPEMRPQFNVNTLLRIIALFCIGFCPSRKLFFPPSQYSIFPKIQIQVLSSFSVILLFPSLGSIEGVHARK